MKTKHEDKKSRSSEDKVLRSSKVEKLRFQLLDRSGPQRPPSVSRPLNSLTPQLLNY